MKQGTSNRKKDCQSSKNMSVSGLAWRIHGSKTLVKIVMIHIYIHRNIHKHRKGQDETKRSDFGLGLLGAEGRNRS